MTVSLGRVIAQLAEPGEEIPPELVDLINANIKPPSNLAADDVFVRAMYVVSDQINSFGGRFPAEEHQRLADLLVDSPVLVGHRKDKLPVGRNFHAVTVDRQGRPWVKSYFYWLRSSDDAEQLRANIDGGVYKECSIAFTFNLPECSVCGQDIRRCEHQPFEEYKRQGVAEKCHFNYRQIERVLETSLVYRGAMPDTTISKDLGGSVPESRCKVLSDEDRRLAPVNSLDELNRDVTYVVVPRYDGLPVTAHVSGDELLMARLDGTPVGGSSGYGCGGFSPEVPVHGILVGYRGKERCTQSQLNDYLSRQAGPVSRLVLNVFPDQGYVSIPRYDSTSDLNIRLIPFRLADGAHLERYACEIMTRDGVEVWPVSSGTPANGSYFSGGYWYRPTGTRRKAVSSPTVILTSDGRMTYLTINGGSPNGANSPVGPLTFQVEDFDPLRLSTGRRFVARRMSNCAASVACRPILSARLGRIEFDGDGLVFDCAGSSAGRYSLRPIRLRGEDSFLFSRMKERVKEEARP